MVFGLSLGPEGLGSSLGETWNHWFSQFVRGPGFAGLFVNDFFLTKAEDVDSLLCILGLCGFEVSLEKFQYFKLLTKLLWATIERLSEGIVPEDLVRILCVSKRSRSTFYLKKYSSISFADGVQSSARETAETRSHA